MPFYGFGRAWLATMQSTTTTTKHPNLGESREGAPRPQEGKPGAASSHPVFRHPLGGNALSAAQAASTPSPLPARLPHVVALSAAPAPLVPAPPVAGAFGGGQVTLGYAQRLAQASFDAVSVQVGDAHPVNLLCAPPTFSRTYAPTSQLRLRADIARAEMAPAEVAGAVMRALGVVGGADRPRASEAIARALAGGSSISWLAAAAACVADLACEEARAYSAATPAAAGAWFDAPAGVAPLPMEAADGYAWGTLAAWGAAGQVVIRASGPEDSCAAILLAVITASSRERGGEAHAGWPGLRRAAWSGASSLAVIRP